MPFDAYIFDLDGTLLDTLPDLHVNVNEALARKGFPPRTIDEVHSFIGNGALALVWSCVPEGTSQADVDEVYSLFCELYKEYGMNLTKPFEGIKEVLTELKAQGKKLGIVSNKFDAGVKAVEARYLPGYFGCAIGESAEIPRKPEPKGLLFCAETLGVEPSQCVYFGDSASDMRAAHNAGMYAAACAWGYPTIEMLKEGEPDVMLSSPEEILSLEKN